jgi:exodeoxyribonuclease VII small subunit
MAKEKKNHQSFESALERLEEIVELLGEGNVSLDEAVKLYEEGAVLSKQCFEMLKNVELRLKKLEKDIEGNIHIKESEQFEK